MSTLQSLVVPYLSEGASVHLSVCIIVHHAPCVILQPKTKIGLSNRHIADDVFALNVHIVQEHCPFPVAFFLS